jgi:hypothetical protein
MCQEGPGIRNFIGAVSIAAPHNFNGPAVNTYEIRIIRKGVKAPDVFSSSHISDHAAVRRAQALADAGDAIEVWRGAACVYAGPLQDAVIH